MFREIKQKATPQVGVRLSQLKDGSLFAFHSEGHQNDQVYMKIQRPDFGKYPDPKCYVISLTGGKVVAVEDCEIHPVEATMEWHFKPWSIRV